jgi:hypothetical protein
MKKLLLALSFLVFPVMAQETPSPLPPAGIKPIQVRMQLYCAESFEYLMDMLAIEFQETPVMMGYLKEGDDANTLVYFVNKDRTQSTLVITKKNKVREESCIVWSGKSPSGMAISINPDPQFPEKT